LGGIIVLTIAYAALAGGRAPVMRATMLVILVCGQLLFYQRPVSFNGLAAAALVVLAWNPMQLTQVGAQLSFIAVAALIWARPLWEQKQPTDALERLKQKHENKFQMAIRVTGQKCRSIAMVSLIIWFATLPLVMYRFHIVTTSALLLNLFLWLPIVVALFLGFGVMLFASLAPAVARLCAYGCSGCLDAMEQLVHQARWIDGSHFWTAGPSLTAVCCFYAVFVLGVTLPRFRRRVLVWAPAALAIIAISTYANSIHPGSRQLRCSFLSLGYGTSVVLELPDGKVWLYDAGSLGSPDATVDEISAFLWNQGIGKLDGLIISHADADHYNAVPGVLARFHVDQVCISPCMMSNFDRLPHELQAALNSADRKLRVIEAGTRFTPSAGVEFTVLHPHAQSLLADDNANSLVLMIDYQQHRLLLPGDLERDGMQQLLLQSPLDCDLVLAPHHGSLYSLPDQFCEWCQPEWIVISGGQIHRAKEIVRRFDEADAHVLHTAVDGLVEASIRDHQFDVQTWKSDD
jgi:competence protein ComEC